MQRRLAICFEHIDQINLKDLQVNLHDLSYLSFFLKDPCALNPCPVGDICSKHGLGLHNCTNPCDSSPCLNSGNCDKDGSGGYKCDCSSTGYNGDNCEIGTFVNSMLS